LSKKLYFKFERHPTTYRYSYNYMQTILMYMQRLYDKGLTWSAKRERRKWVCSLRVRVRAEFNIYSRTATVQSSRLTFATQLCCIWKFGIEVSTLYPFIHRISILCHTVAYICIIAHTVA
jgi:hypothetical protein